MKFAIISDVHANLEALQAVFARIPAIDEVYCLGDVIGYGAQPNECLDLVRARASVTVLGNHDVAAVDDHGVELFNDNARDAIRWTQGVLTRENAAWLDGLAYEFRMPEYLLVHGAPADYFRYILNEEAARAAFAATDAALVFVGHTHVAGFFALLSDGSIRYEARRSGGSLDLEPGTRYIVNVGSVGQPRDRNPEASYVTYDPENRRVAWDRVPYEVALAQRKILRARLPDALAHRLESGR